ncbi:hypothetical protein Acr_00g0031190 [Actinidia rufa]|uniref:Uncharacterized protein n=1 Tax=Actinidia rufa TaxID=165716 RepID=A0A7J0DF23_9ERIC|nr:hypothetical protein Acr_00g0031190 [Actinidia rufa]
MPKHGKKLALIPKLIPLKSFNIDLGSEEAPVVKFLINANPEHGGASIFHAREQICVEALDGGAVERFDDDRKDEDVGDKDVRFSLGFSDFQGSIVEVFACFN